MEDIAGKKIDLGDTVAFAIDNVLVLGAVIRLFLVDNIVIISVDDELYERSANQVVKVEFDSLIEMEEINNDIRANESNNRQYTNIFPRIYRESCTYYHAR